MTKLEADDTPMSDEVRQALEMNRPIVLGRNRRVQNESAHTPKPIHTQTNTHEKEIHTAKNTHEKAKPKRINITMDPVLHEKAKIVAKNYSLTFSGLISELIKSEVIKAGI